MNAKEAIELSLSNGGIRDTSYEDYNADMLSQILEKITKNANRGMFKLFLIIKEHREEVIDSLKELGYDVKVRIEEPNNPMSSIFIQYTISW